MLLNRAILLALLLAGCSAQDDRSKTRTDANQADKLRELQTRVEKLEKRAKVEDMALGAVPGIDTTSPVAFPLDDREERIQKLERAERDRAYNETLAK